MIEFFFSFSTCTFLSEEFPEAAGFATAVLPGAPAIIIVTVTTRHVAAIKNDMFFA